MTMTNWLYSVCSAWRISAALEYPSSCAIFSGGICDKVSARMVALMVGTAVGAPPKTRKPKPASNGTPIGSHPTYTQIEKGNLPQLAQPTPHGARAVDARCQSTGT